ncbi:uncharacterized protein MYCFIDRAFT_87847 [Pseudocercospora fijiensis CIRAD86]|uniref:RING-type domain-containing protein n=1 Tax=Pseudocercospora fijiensis (strain CIRAD86) TaxID=383855 RepID=M3A2C8_PSEFD|nr:uncharacterized protein MYCFIDRAFT_87847 [Pseudocercospora fijiensis CIRAD86]EME78556.1 hypothetical protein MYCFIDRAFT_87847 [Pseudocercospora fijiensis CIRAD86]
MDAVLHCNDLTCRANVPDQAVVTTCSHIFCIPCANRLGLSEPQDGQRRCPACKTDLTNPDDAVITSLNPTEDYKTSILSGLSPTIIMECAGRGLGFWAYQMAQEITYQQYLATSLADRWNQLNTQMQNVADKEKDENKRLRQRLDALHAENANLMENNAALDRSYKEKAKAQHQINNLYQKLKAQQLAAGLEVAAENDADNVLAHANQQTRISAAQRPTKNVHARDFSDGSGGSEERRNRHRDYTWSQNNASQGYQVSAAPRNSGTSHSLPMSGSQQQSNRQRLPQPAFGSYNSTFLGGTGLGNAGLRQGTVQRGPYGNSQGHGQSGYDDENVSNSRYGAGGMGGMSAGVRAGRPPGAIPLSRAGGVGPMRPGGYPGMRMG